MVEHLEVERKMQVPHQSCRVAVVNGSSDVIDLLETVLDAGQYDLAFVDASDRAYSEIKTMRPNLIVLCVRIEDLDGFHLLSMLKIDDETRQIPVLTYTTEYEGQDEEERFTRMADDLFTPQVALRMN